MGWSCPLCGVFSEGVILICRIGSSVKTSHNVRDYKVKPSQPTPELDTKTSTREAPPPPGPKVCLCSMPHVIASHCMLLHVIACHHMLSHVITCHCMSSHVITCHRMSSHVIAWYCISSHVFARYYLSSCAVPCPVCPPSYVGVSSIMCGCVHLV